MKIFITDASEFGVVGATAVHQILETDRDFEQAFERAERDQFPAIYFYLRGLDSDPRGCNAAGWIGRCTELESVTLVRVV